MCKGSCQLFLLLLIHWTWRVDSLSACSMSYLAGNMLLYMDPFTAFVCFANLLNSPYFHVFLKLDTDKMSGRFQVFNTLFKEHLPKLFR